MPAIMNHRDRIRQDRELLGRESFSTLSLDEFLHEIDLKYPTQISRKRILLLFVTWLHDCLLDCLVDGRESDKSKKPQILRPKIQEWLDFLRKCYNRDQVIRDTFKEWQRDEAAKKDRDYQIKLKTIDIEFEYVLKKFSSTPISSPVPATTPARTAAPASFPTPTRTSARIAARTAARTATPASTPTSASPAQHGHMHPTRLNSLPSLRSGHARLNKVAPVEEAPSHGNIHPDRMNISRWPCEEGEVGEDDDDIQIRNSVGGWDTYHSKPEKNKTKKKEEGGRDPSSFLTGSSRMILDGDMPASTAGGRKMRRNAPSKPRPDPPLLTEMANEAKGLLWAAGGGQDMRDDELPKSQPQWSTATSSGPMVLDAITPSSVAVARGTQRGEPLNGDGGPSLIHPERMTMLDKMSSSANIGRQTEPAEPPKWGSDLSFLRGPNRMFLEEKPIPSKLGGWDANRNEPPRANEEIPSAHPGRMILKDKMLSLASNDRGLNHDKPAKEKGGLSMHPDRLMILDEYKPLPTGNDRGMLPSQPPRPLSDLSFLTGSNRIIFDKNAPLSTTNSRKKLQLKPPKTNASEKHDFLIGSNRMILGAKGPSSDQALPRKRKNVEEDTSRQPKKPRVEDRVCVLCGGDHYLPKECPARLDPRDGSAPFKTYKCGLCQAVGNHYTIDCPQKRGDRLEVKGDYYRTSSLGDKSRPEDQPSTSKSDFHSDLALRSASEQGSRLPFPGAREIFHRFQGSSYRPAYDVPNRGQISIKGLASSHKDPVSLNGDMKYRDWGKKHGGLADDLLSFSESRNEGRLSYHNGDNGSPPPFPVSTRSRATYSKAQVSQTDILADLDGHPIAETKGSQLDDLIVDMIISESAKAAQLVSDEMGSTKTDILTAETKSESMKVNLPTAETAVRILPGDFKTSLTPDQMLEGRSRLDLVRDSPLWPIKVRLPPSGTPHEIVEDTHSNFWVSAQGGLKNTQKKNGGETHCPADETEVATVLPSEDSPGTVNGHSSPIPEFVPPWDPVILKLFKGKQITWIHRKPRPSALDFFDLVAEVNRKREEQPGGKGGGVDSMMEIGDSHQPGVAVGEKTGLPVNDSGMKVDCTEQPQRSAIEETTKDVAVPESAMDIDECLQSKTKNRRSIEAETKEGIMENDQKNDAGSVVAAAWTLNIGSPVQQDAERVGILLGAEEYEDQETHESQPTEGALDLLSDPRMDVDNIYKLEIAVEEEQRVSVVYTVMDLPAVSTVDNPQDTKTTVMREEAEAAPLYAVMDSVTGGSINTNVGVEASHPEHVITHKVDHIKSSQIVVDSTTDVECHISPLRRQDSDVTSVDRDGDVVMGMDEGDAATTTERASAVDGY